jgi:hypothetical protein
MVTAKTTFAEIQQEITAKRGALNETHAVRQAIRAYNTRPASVPPMAPAVAMMAPAVAAAPAHRTLRLLAQGDSWFDYPLGTDIIDCLHSNHGHQIVNIAVAGSTLNDEAYGPVPREMFGLPIGTPLSDDPSRIAELVHRIVEDKPQALLLSAGGNDVAGDEFFSFLNNAQSGLEEVNRAVLQGVMTETFTAAYSFLVDAALAAAASAGITLPIFVHGYDYPWPDGRGVVAFLGWKVGPWFDPTFSAKNYPNANAADLQRRHDILSVFIDAMNSMQEALAAKYPGKVFHIDLTHTLASSGDWANELHPSNGGFEQLAAKIDSSLQQHVP